MNSQDSTTPDNSQQSNKSFSTALWLSVFLGLWGIDSFYLGDAKRGFLKLFTAGGFLILWIQDIIRISKGLDTTGGELRGFSASKRKNTFIAISSVAVVLWVVGYLNPDGGSVNYSSGSSDNQSEIKLDENGYEEFTSKSCWDIKVAITMIRNGAENETTTVSQMALLLQSASSTWSSESSKYTGSRSAWLNQLSSLADDLVAELNGGPSSNRDVYQLLVNNMNLETQYCD